MEWKRLASTKPSLKSLVPAGMPALIPDLNLSLIFAGDRSSSAVGKGLRVKSVGSRYSVSNSRHSSYILTCNFLLIKQYAIMKVSYLPPDLNKSQNYFKRTNYIKFGEIFLLNSLARFFYFFGKVDTFGGVWRDFSLKLAGVISY